ncbi:uncharacterized protein K489DRAFT_378270, partial [Dissoconium aciculare CBS 342.82]|uniref:Uncharacterized protein n=1 Tax=Dissoconium aciculare CBS 342.82 TaxID=1314786 RepID=A0A6J3MCX4_9PEZI
MHTSQQSDHFLGISPSLRLSLSIPPGPVDDGRLPTVFGEKKRKGKKIPKSPWRARKAHVPRTVGRGRFGDDDDDNDDDDDDDEAYAHATHCPWREQTWRRRSPPSIDRAIDQSIN